MKPNTIMCPCCFNEKVEVSEVWNNCPYCQHRWRNEVVTDAGAYYQELKNRNNIKSDSFHKKVTDRFNTVRPLITNGVSRVLEVGCAEGFLGEITKKQFSLIYDGIEISQDAEIAINKLDHVYRTTTIHIDGGAYDLICSFHVLEHISNISSELKQWQRLLSDEGRVVIEVPNRAGHSLLANDGNPEHLHQFTLQSLSCLLAHEGFEIISATTGHFESAVYSDSTSIVAKRALTKKQKETLLISRFERKLNGPFIVYGIGGDFLNYIYPVINSLPIIGLLDSSATQWGKEIAGMVVTKYNQPEHENRKILVASIKYKNEIVEHLIQLDIPRNLIRTLDEIYG